MCEEADDKMERKSVKGTEKVRKMPRTRMERRESEGRKKSEERR